MQGVERVVGVVPQNLKAMPSLSSLDGLWTFSNKQMVCVLRTKASHHPLNLHLLDDDLAHRALPLAPVRETVAKSRLLLGDGVFVQEKVGGVGRGRGRGRGRMKKTNSRKKNKRSLALYVR